MDNGNGTFREINESEAVKLRAAMPTNHSIFCVGEKFNLRGSTFEICSIGRKKMKVKLLERGTL